MCVVGKWLVNHLQMHRYVYLRGPLSEAIMWSVLQDFLRVKVYSARRSLGGGAL